MNACRVQNTRIWGNGIFFKYIFLLDGTSSLLSMNVLNFRTKTNVRDTFVSRRTERNLEFHWPLVYLDILRIRIFSGLGLILMSFRSQHFHENSFRPMRSKLVGPVVYVCVCYYCVSLNATTQSTDDNMLMFFDRWRDAAFLNSVAWWSFTLEPVLYVFCITAIGADRAEWVPPWTVLINAAWHTISVTAM